MLKPSAMLAQAILNTKQQLGLRDGERCIAMYVRRGDKVNDVGMPNEGYLVCFLAFVATANTSMTHTSRYSHYQPL